MKQKSTETQLEPTKHQQLVSTRKELDWIKTRLSDTQSEEESTGKWRTEKDGEIKWLKKRLVETLAELDSSKNEVEGLRLNSAWSGSGSSVSSAGTPRYPTGGEGGGWTSDRRTLLAQCRFPHLALGLRHRGQGASYYRQQYRPST